MVETAVSIGHGVKEMVENDLDRGEVGNEGARVLFDAAGKLSVSIHASQAASEVTYIAAMSSEWAAETVMMVSGKLLCRQ